MIEITDPETNVIYTFRESLTAREFRAIKKPMNENSKDYTPEAWEIDIERYQDELTLALSIRPKLTKDMLLDIDVMFLTQMQLKVCGEFTAGFQKAIDTKEIPSLKPKSL